MAAPVITWFRCTKSGPTYSAITSLNFGTITAGAWSVQQCIRAKVATNSIASAKWWMYDKTATWSGVAKSVGTAASWRHFMTVTNTYITVTSATPKGSAGLSAAGWKEVPQSTGSGVAASAVAAAAYGEFTYFAIHVATAAGDGAWTAWGYQLKYSYT